jgi:hypothetical protein
MMAIILFAGFVTFAVITGYCGLVWAFYGKPRGGI